MKMIRLDKFLCEQTGRTRKEAKKMLKDGRITVNDVMVKKPELKVALEQDQVALDGKVLEEASEVYIMLNKPKGVVSATKDSISETVAELVAHLTHKEVFPVGRLDKDTTGLLLLTNDGMLAHELLSPKKHVDKKYEVLVTGRMNQREIQLFQEGMDIGEKHITKPALLEVLCADDTSSKVYVTIREGKYHQIKRMFHKVGSEVLELKRVSMGSLCLDETLVEGEARRLTKDEVERLKESYVKQ